MITPPSTLRERVVRGATWTLSTSLGTRAVGLIGTVLLARYLAPAEYGVVMAATIAATTATTVTTFGVGTYLIAKADLSRSEAFHASCWFLATGATALVGTMLLADHLERWSAAPGLVQFLEILIGAAAFERLLYIPERILVRNLRFRWLSVARTGGELTYTAVSVALAASGGGAMAIAWGTLARSVFRFATILPAVPLREWLEPHRLHRATLLKIASFGANFSLTSVATFGMRRWDNLLISRYLGPSLAGTYNYAYNLADTPGAAIGDQISDVIAASFRHVDRRRRAQALIRACAMFAMIMFPLSFGLGVVAPTVVVTFFDARWADVATMLMYLSSLSATRPLVYVLSAYWYASNRASVVLWLEWASLAGIVSAVATFSRVGMIWTCLSVSAVFALRMLAGMWIVHRQDGVPMSAFLRPLSKPLAACIAMAVAVTAVRFAFSEVSAPQLLFIEIAAGAITYCGTMLAIARPLCDEFLHAIGVGRDAAKHQTERKTLPALSVLSLTSEFPNPFEKAKGLFVRSRLRAVAERAQLLVVAPVAALDYANPERRLFASWRIPRERSDGDLLVLHPRWAYPPRGGWTNAFFLFARLLPLLVRLQRCRPFDLIDAHFAHPEGVAAVALARVLALPVLVTIRGSELRYARHRTKRFWMAWALRRADRVIAVSGGLRDLAIELGADARRVKTVPNGIDAEIFFPRDRVKCRQQLAVGVSERVILTAGDLAELKGHHRAIEAVKTLRDRGMHVRLLIAGGVGRSGRYAETLRQQVADAALGDRVAFLGEMTQTELAEVMCAVDVFCLASSTEGWPNVVNEALACGTPVVATDVGAVRQMITSAAYGSVVPVQDDEALTRALQTALNRPWDRQAISEWGRSRSWSKVADEVLEQMHAAVSERSTEGRRVSSPATPDKAFATMRVAARLTRARLGRS